MNNWLAEKGRAVHVTSLDFSEPSETASHKILTEKLSVYGLDEQTENRMAGSRGSHQFYNGCLETKNQQCAPEVNTGSSPVQSLAVNNQADIQSGRSG